MFENTVRIENEHVFVKPLCDFFEITYDNQAVKIKNDPILSKSAGKKPLKSLFGDNHPRLYLDKKGFIRWIQIINPSIIREDLRDSFIKYQALIFDFFYGSAEQETTIRSLVAEQQDVDNRLKELASQKRKIRKALNQALLDRYQYSLDFNQQSSISN